MGNHSGFRDLGSRVIKKIINSLPKRSIKPVRIEGEKKCYEVTLKRDLSIDKSAK